MKMSTVLTIVLVGIALWYFYNQFSPAKGFKNLSANEFRNEIKGKDKVVIDVREIHEYQSGYIQGAVNIPLSELKERINEIPHDKEVYLYCRSGNRSKQAAKILIKNGFTDLAHLEGGIMSWNGKLEIVNNLR